MKTRCRVHDPEPNYVSVDALPPHAVRTVMRCRRCRKYLGMTNEMPGEIDVDTYPMTPASTLEDAPS